jgi:DnaJ-domain-containing protein 1
MPGPLSELAAKFQQTDSDRLRSNVYLIQVGLGALFIGLLFLFRKRDDTSFFRSHGEGGTQSKSTSRQTGPALGYESPKPTGKKPAPLLLAGIRLEGAPHEILGVSPQATKREIQKAYRNLMKRYHPDVVAPAGSQRWKEAQKIAEAINRAKDAMLGKP